MKISNHSHDTPTTTTTTGTPHHQYQQQQQQYTREEPRTEGYHLSQQQQYSSNISSSYDKSKGGQMMMMTQSPNPIHKLNNLPVFTPITTTVTNNNTNTLLNINNIQLLLMKKQHEKLYPDRKIDLLSDSGITDFRVYSLESCIQITSLFSQLIQEASGNYRNSSSAVIDSIKHLLGNTQQQQYGQITNQNIILQKANKSPNMDKLEKCMNFIITLVPESSVGIHPNIRSTLDSNSSSSYNNHVTQELANDSMDRDMYSGTLYYYY